MILDINGFVDVIGKSYVSIAEDGDNESKTRKKYVVVIGSKRNLTKKQAKQLREDLVYRFNNFREP